MLRTYDPGKVVISFKGIVFVAPADGTFITVERDEDTWSKSYGSDGDVARVRNRKRGGKATVTLMGISPTNDQLSTIVDIDERTGLGVGTFQVLDLNGTTLVHATNGWLVRPANYEAGNEHTNREWMIDLEVVDMFIGGELF